MEVKGYKAFNNDKTNRYGIPFEEGKTYTVNEQVSFGNNGHGFHMCANLADVFRYFHYEDDEVCVAEVTGKGTIVKYDDEKIKALLENQGIIRNKLKIKASIKNSIIFKRIQKEFGSFAKYIWAFSDNKIIYESCDIRTSSPLSDNISKDLKKRGMTFVGTTIIYSYLQSIGIINAHTKHCFLYKAD